MREEFFGPGILAMLVQPLRRTLVLLGNSIEHFLKQPKT